MWKRFVALLGLLLMLAQSGLAEVAPGQYAQETERMAREMGLEVKTNTTFAWGGLPLLADAENKAISSFLKAFETRVRRQGGQDGGYVAVDLMLQNVSVLDMAWQAMDGVYYEQSNLLGGQTVAFTPEEFSAFAGRLSARTDGAMPANLDVLFSAVMQALGGEPVAIDPETVDGALLTLETWKQDALTTEERLRPKVYIPGLYGTRAVVVDVTREEAIALAQAYSALLSENDTLWESAAASQLPQDADSEALHETAQKIADTMRSLPDTVAKLLPEGIQPGEYREIFGADDALVVRQLEIPLSEGAYLFAEWAPADTGNPPLYASLSLADSIFELLITHERGEPVVTGEETRLKNRGIAQFTYADADMRLDMTVTRTENVQTMQGKETTLVRLDCMMESEALFGQGAVVTLSVDRTQVASGTVREKYTKRTETSLRLKGLGFDDRKILTASSKTVLAEAAPPVDLAAGMEILRPAQMEEAAFAEWLSSLEVGYLQVWYTVLGRLPADVATYLLGSMQAGQ